MKGLDFDKKCQSWCLLSDTITNTEVGTTARNTHVFENTEHVNYLHPFVQILVNLYTLSIRIW